MFYESIILDLVVQLLLSLLSGFSSQLYSSDVSFVDSTWWEGGKPLLVRDCVLSSILVRDMVEVLIRVSSGGH